MTEGAATAKPADSTTVRGSSSRTSRYRYAASSKRSEATPWARIVLENRNARSSKPVNSFGPRARRARNRIRAALGRRSPAPRSGSGAPLAEGASSYQRWRAHGAAPYSDARSLSVVIPTSRGGADLETCLVSLVDQDYPAVEVVVVDNASPDLRLRSPGRLPRRQGPAQRGEPRLRRSEQPGNRGLERRLILLLNDDTALEPGALRALVEELTRHPAWGACQAKLLLMDDPAASILAGSFLTATGFLIHRGASSPKTGSRFDEIFAAKGAALLVRRRALEEVGTFDPDLLRVLRRDGSLLAPLACGLGGWLRGRRTSAAQTRCDGVGVAFSVRAVPFVQEPTVHVAENTGTARLAAMVPVHIVLCGGLAGWYAARRQPKIGAAILRAVGWNVAQLPRTLAKRREIQARRRVSDSELMPRIKKPASIRTLVSYARGGPAQKPGSTEVRSA